MGLDGFLKLAVDASIASAIAIARERKDLQIWQKNDGTLLSSADLISDEILSLKLGTSGLPVLSEESVAGYSGGNELFWLIDPIDGTKGFCKGGRDYCILIALIRNGRPILAVLNAPERGLLFYAHEKSKLYKNGKFAHKKDCKRHKNIALVSEYHKDAKEEAFILKNDLKPSYISSAVKITRLLEGQAGVYYKARGLHIWDIATSDFLLEKNGGIMCDHEGNKLIYKDDELLSKPFIALADKDFIKDFIL